MRGRLLAGGVLAAVAVVAYLLGAGGTPTTRADPPADKERPPVAGRYQAVPAPGDGKTDLLVVDTATGQTWAYTARDAWGYRWVDYGVPAAAKK